MMNMTTGSQTSRLTGNGWSLDLSGQPHALLQPQEQQQHQLSQGSQTGDQQLSDFFNNLDGLSILNGYGEFVCRGHVQACVEFGAAGIRHFQPAVSDFAAGSGQHQFCAVMRLFRPRARHIQPHY